MKNNLYKKKHCSFYGTSLNQLYFLTFVLFWPTIEQSLFFIYIFYGFTCLKLSFLTLDF